MYAGKEAGIFPFNSALSIPQRLLMFLLQKLNSLNYDKQWIAATAGFEPPPISNLR